MLASANMVGTLFVGVRVSWLLSVVLRGGGE